MRGGSEEAPGLHPLESDPAQRCFPSSRGNSWACWLLQYPRFLQRAVMTPRAAQVPALCLSFPILPVVLSVATHGCCSCPCDLSFSGTEVVVSVVCGLLAQFPGTRGSITCGPARSWLSRRVWAGKGPWDANPWAGLDAPSRK